MLTKFSEPAFGNADQGLVVWASTVKWAFSPGSNSYLESPKVNDDLLYYSEFQDCWKKEASVNFIS